MSAARGRKTADALRAGSLDGERCVRRAAIATAVELRGLHQSVPFAGRVAAANASQNTFDSGHSAAWAVLAGWRVLDYWTPGEAAPWSVLMAGTMP